MNLLHDPWMPVLDEHGQREWISPDRLGDSRWRAFDAARPDFNGALAQFAIGLLQTTTPVTGTPGWRACFREPPQAAVLRQWFEPVAAAFDLDGNGARFMQDRELEEEAAVVNDVGVLLIDSPGEQALSNNTDHFVKRKQIDCLCHACAATALLALQINAPAGGSGYRTGLRGGGPLTTLVMAPDGSSLWQHLWLNVADRSSFLGADAATPPSLDQRTFPWLGPIARLQAADGELAMSLVHPAHHYWAMPRRIRLHVEAAAPDESAVCDLCGRRLELCVRRYATRNRGLNYKGEWNHPLSPYYAKDEGWLPLHPQPGGLGYRHWLAWVLGVASERQTTRVAPVVSRAIEQLRRQVGPALRIWAFGYDMDNMKARCWYEATLPIYGLSDCEPDALAMVQAEVGRWLSAAELSVQALRGAIKDAWFGHDARGSQAHVDTAYWSATEVSFYGQLQALIEGTRAGAPPDAVALREEWHRILVRTALHLFDGVFVGSGPLERQNPRRIAEAYRRMLGNLHGRKLRQALGLPVPENADKPRRAGKATTNDSASKETA